MLELFSCPYQLGNCYHLSVRPRFSSSLAVSRPSAFETSIPSSLQTVFYQIKNGKHPILDNMASFDCVPNDVYLYVSDRQVQKQSQNPNERLYETVLRVHMPFS